MFVMAIRATDEEACIVASDEDGGMLFEPAYNLHTTLRAGGFRGSVLLLGDGRTPLEIPISETLDEDRVQGFLAPS